MLLRGERLHFHRQIQRERRDRRGEREERERRERGCAQEGFWRSRCGGCGAQSAKKNGEYNDDDDNAMARKSPGEMDPPADAGVLFAELFLACV